MTDSLPHSSTPGHAMKTGPNPQVGTVIGKAILVMVVLLWLTSTVLADGGGPYVSRYVISGGGGHSEMGRYVMDATVGQAAMGMFSNTPYELFGGFWCGMGE